MGVLIDGGNSLRGGYIGNHPLKGIDYGSNIVWRAHKDELRHYTGYEVDTVPDWFTLGVDYIDMLALGGGGSGGAGSGGVGYDGNDTKLGLDGRYIQYRAPGGAGGSSGTASSAAEAEGEAGESITHWGHTLTGGAATPVVEQNDYHQPQGNSPAGGGPGSYVNYFGIYYGYGGNGGSWSWSTSLKPTQDRHYTVAIGAGGAAVEYDSQTYSGPGAPGAMLLRFRNYEI